MTVGRRPNDLAARTEALWAGAWVEIVETLVRGRVLYAPDRPGRASARLVECGARIVDQGPAQTVIVEAASTAREVEVAMQAATETVVAIGDSRFSPLRAVDVTRGRPGGPTGVSRRAATRILAELGTPRTYILLRNSQAPVLVADTDRPESAAAMRAVMPWVDGGRGRLLEALVALGGVGGAVDVAPAWMVVASRNPLDALPVARVGHRGTPDSLLFASSTVEKRFSDPTRCATETAALVALAGTGVVPELVDHGPAHVRTTWLPGRALAPARLSPDGVVRWAQATAALVARGHLVTAATDGTTIVHGDLWLGNVVVDGDHVSGIVDWECSYRGDPADDLHQLVERNADSGRLAVERVRLLEAVYAAHEAAGGPARARPTDGRLGR